MFKKWKIWPWILVLFSIVAARNVTAQNEPRPCTDRTGYKLINYGREWNAWSNGSRSIYLEGFVDGESHTYWLVLNDVPPERREPLRLQTATFYESDALRDLMTSLYSDPANTYVTYDFNGLHRSRQARRKRHRVRAEKRAPKRLRLYGSREISGSSLPFSRAFPRRRPWVTYVRSAHVCVPVRTAVVVAGASITKARNLGPAAKTGCSRDPTPSYGSAQHKGRSHATYSVQGG